MKRRTFVKSGATLGLTGIGLTAMPSQVLAASELRFSIIAEEELPLSWISTTPTDRTYRWIHAMASNDLYPGWEVHSVWQTSAGISMSFPHLNIQCDDWWVNPKQKAPTCSWDIQGKKGSIGIWNVRKWGTRVAASPGWKATWLTLFTEKGEQRHVFSELPPKTNLLDLPLHLSSTENANPIWIPTRVV